MAKKLKLTKLTVSNLDRVRSGIGECACEAPPPTGQSWNAAWNINHHTALTQCIPWCPQSVQSPVCAIDDI